MVRGLQLPEIVVFGLGTGVGWAMLLWLWLELKANVW